TEVDDSLNSAILRINDSDPIVLIGIGIDLSLYPLQFIQLGLYPIVSHGLNIALLTQCFRVEDPDLLGAVTFVKPFPVIGQAPTFFTLIISKSSNPLEGFDIVNKSFSLSPGELVDLIIKDGHAFGKE